MQADRRRPVVQCRFGLVLGAAVVAGIAVIAPAKAVTNVDHPARGAITSATRDGATVTVRGWSFDPDHPGHRSYVEVYVNRHRVRRVLTILASPSADRKFHLTGTHGWRAAIHFKSGGTKRIAAYGLDLDPPREGLGIGVRRVVVPSCPTGRAPTATVTGMTAVPDTFLGGDYYDVTVTGTIHNRTTATITIGYLAVDLELGAPFDFTSIEVGDPVPPEGVVGFTATQVFHAAEVNAADPAAYIDIWSWPKLLSFCKEPSS
jgi:hypothetical protein